MTRRQVFVDATFVRVLLDPTDPRHTGARAAWEVVVGDNPEPGLDRAVAMILMRRGGITEIATVDSSTRRSG